MLTSPIATRTAMSDGDKLKPITAQGRRGTPLDDTADVRDSLALIVGGGYNAISDDSIKAHVKRLQGLLGAPVAQKLVNHALLFNQREDIRGKSVKDRVDAFYNIPSGDEEVGGLLRKVKGFGYGTRAGLNDSLDADVQDVVAGRPHPKVTPGMLAGMTGIPLR